MKTLDHIQFILPVDDELFIAAMTTLQKYVNNYEARSKANDVTRGKQVFELIYSVGTVLRKEFSYRYLWDMLLDKAEFKLNQKPVPVQDELDVIFDMSDKRLLLWANSGKHAVQVCSIMCGEESRVFPEVKQIKPKVHGEQKWWNAGMYSSNDRYEKLTSFSNEEFTGVVGVASGVTYLAASMGLPVIELIPRERNKAWLSKWINHGYRLIYDTGDKVENTRLIDQAKASIMEYLLTRKESAAKETSEQVVGY